MKLNSLLLIVYIQELVTVFHNSTDHKFGVSNLISAKGKMTHLPSVNDAAIE